MTLLSLTFLVLSAAAIVLYWLVPAGPLRQAVLFCSTGIWFIFGVWWHALAAVGIGTVAWAMGRWMLRRREDERGVVLFIGCVTMVGLFFYFRYFAIWMGQSPSASGTWLTPNPLLAPVGLSFMMFEAIAFFADIYLGKLERSGSWWSHVVFAMYFPTRIIGPLRKYQDFTEQLATVSKPSPQEFAEGGGRILAGVLKKAVIANPVGSFAVFSLQPALIESGGSRATLGLGAVAYWIYLYFDLSGYSDIVIGLSRLFGLRIQENFQRPYAATNISEYWQRWHMSLSAWVREYVYTPVAIWARGSRWGPPMAALASMVVLGLWHGLELRYLLFGLWQGLMLAGFMIWRDLTRKTPLAKRLGASRMWTVAGWTSVIVSAIFSHVFFAVPSARLAFRWFRVVLG